MASEKTTLLPHPVGEVRTKKRRTSSTLLPYILLPVLLISLVFRLPLLYFVSKHGGHHHHGPAVPVESQCEQPNALFPSLGDKKLQDAFDYISTDEFRAGSIKRHSGAVQIPTQSFDDMGAVGEDPRWDVMYKFQEYLEKTFPRVHKHMHPEAVNTHGLLYTYQGSDTSLKPLVLMAHQDVVPVPNNTVKAWTHPPFSGYYDGTFIWGRGSSDCKNQLIAIMESMELLLEAEYQPKRTVVLSFGFDEEISGGQGAANLAATLLERYGKDGVAAVVDEGSQFQQSWGTAFAAIGVGEKGYTDVTITVRMPGGHSSVPVDHTSIGVVAELITKIESEQYRTYLTDENPYLGQLQCGAAHSAEFPKKLKKLLGSHEASTCKAKPDILALEAAKQGPRVKYLMQTSQAVDVIDGGLKVNALPERASVTINHRINVGEEPELVWDRLTSLSKEVASKYGLKVHAFDGVEEEPMSITLIYAPGPLRVAPVTPTSVDTNTPYRILAGTTRAVYGEDIIVSPGMASGNTDTRFYWDLTRHIFRFGPGYDPKFDSGQMNNVHTVDEHVSVVNHIGMVKWFTTLVRNLDETELDD